MLWIDYDGWRRHLTVLTADRGRTTRHRVHLPAGSPAFDELDAAVRTLSHGRLELADRAPDGGWSEFDDGPGRPFRAGRRVSLPAWSYVVLLPLIAVCLPVVLDRPQPWRQPWWPGIQAAAAAPDPCDAISAEAARDLFAYATARPIIDRSSRRTCRIDGGQAELTVDYFVFNPVFGSGDDDAVEHLNEARSRTGKFRPEPVPGLGDQAWIAGNSPGTTTLIDRGQAMLVARRANVVLEIFYGGEREPEVARAAVLAAAQRAIGALRIG
jgi:hypothetical protein